MTQIKKISRCALSELTSAELYNCLSYKQKDDIYRKVWYEHVKDDAYTLIEEEFTKEQLHGRKKNNLAEQIAHAYVYDGKYDCNFSYWDNLGSLLNYYYDAEGR